MELSKVLSSDGSEFLSFDLTSDCESVSSSGFKLLLVSGNLSVDDNESHLTFFHGDLSSSCNLGDESGISFLICYVDYINFLSISGSSRHGSLLESG